MTKWTTREVVLCGLFVALITAGTLIRIPIGGDVYTLQFLFTLLAGLVLGARLGALAVGVYVLLGLIGVPVFASGGGFGYVLQPTFGYLLGFIVQAYLCGYIARLGRLTKMRLLAANLVGMAVVYLFGLSWFYVISNFVIDIPVSLWWVVLYCGILQVGPDFILCIAAAGLGFKLAHAGFWLHAPLTTTTHIHA